MMSHSPLRMFKKYHDKCVLVSGQGPVLDIAKKYPFEIQYVLSYIIKASTWLDKRILGQQVA